MRIQRITFGTLLLAAISLLTPALRAQHEIHNIPPLVSYAGDNPDLTHPFIDPFAFNPDYQFFAPADLTGYGGRPEAKTGWYGEFNRNYIWVSRPDYTDQGTNGDFTWGWRADLGYMSCEDHGWAVSFTHIDGPGQYEELITERINRFNEDDEVNGLPPADPADDPNQVIPIRDRNDPTTQARDYIIQNSENAGNFAGFELNKTFRLKTLHYGSTVEPFFGVRYNKFKDIFLRQTYRRFDDTTGLPVIGFPPPPDPADVTIEQVDSLTTNFTNQMIGGQLGLRWYTTKQRWDLSGEFRAFCMQNFQQLSTVLSAERTYYPDVGLNPDVDAVLMEQIIINQHAAEIVPGMEARAEAAYSLTRDVALNVGINVMYFGRGIGRGDNINDNSQDLTMVGAIFGLQVNR